jgi:ATP-binding cassette, subfamily B, bacterial
MKFRSWLHIVRASQLYLVLRSNRLLTLGIALSMLGQTALTVIQPWPLRAIIDHLIANPTAGRSSLEGIRHNPFRLLTASLNGFLQTADFDFLFRNTGYLVAIFALGAVLLYTQNNWLAQLGQKTVLAVRGNLFSHLISLSESFFEKRRTGDLTSRISKDTADIQDMLESFLTISVRSLPTVIGILIVSFSLDWVYALTFLFVIPQMYWANAIFTRRTKEAVRKQRRIEGTLASNAQEALYCHKAIMTLSLEEGVIDDFLAGGRESAFHGVRAGRSQGMLAASMDFMIGATSVVILFVGALRIVRGCLTIGQLTVFLSYLNSLFKPIREMSKFATQMAKSSAALERIEEIMHLNPNEVGVADLPHAVQAHPFRGDIELCNVTFEYVPDRPVLDDFSLSIRAGQTVALVGGSGSGKSTIIQLIMRLYDPQRGQVTIDGLDIRNFKLVSLRGQMAVAPQDSYIFNMSIKENVAIARAGAGDCEILDACKAAGLDECVQDLSMGYDTCLGEGGSGLSGGQKRRIAIARVILRCSPVLILDEPTSGLDAESERKAIEALKHVAKGKTLIIVTHQLSTIVDADCIVVLSQGRIAEMGTHEQLVQSGGIYTQLWAAQQTGNGLSPHSEALKPAYSALPSASLATEGRPR